MKTAVYSIHKFEKEYLLKANADRHDLVLIEARLSETSVPLADGCEAISIFTGDKATAPVLEALHQMGVKHLALRSAGFNHVDLVKAKKLNMQVARVPAYSPYAIAEHTVALMLALNRKLIRAHHRVMDLNFSLDGLVGFDMNGKTVGIIGTGKIGSVLARILHGFGCRILAHDKVENKELIERYQVEYTTCESLCKQSDIITLHVPLTESTRYIIDKHCIDKMKPGVMLINTSRGGLVNTKAVINALKVKHIGSFGLDVYEEEEGLFFEDHSEDILQDDTIARLMTFKNVLITSHQAFLTETALQNIAETTVTNLDCFAANTKTENEIII
jgi:D-lactate dehydrogenase